MNIFRILPVLILGALPITAGAQVLQENFDSFSALFTGTNPWSLQNRSDSPAGGQSWFAGTTDAFPAQSGSGYVAANYLSTGGIAGTETISNWLISPTFNIANGEVITFFTRSGGAAPDRLQLRLSLSGTSTNVGTGSSDFGDFTVLALDINPTQTAGIYPTGWTQYSAVIAGVPLAGTTGRLAFRYNVAGSGVNGLNGDYVGVDTLRVNLVPEPSTYAFGLLGLTVIGGVVLHRRRTEATAMV